MCYCSAHIFNFLANDIKISGTKEHMKQIIKYFKYHHIPAAKLKQSGSKSLILPIVMFDGTH